MKLSIGEVFAEAWTLYSRHAGKLIVMAAEGYPFPANLDVTPPVGGMAPASQVDLVRQALLEDWPQDRLAAALDQQLAERRS